MTLAQANPESNAKDNFSAVAALWKTSSSNPKNTAGGGGAVAKPVAAPKPAEVAPVEVRL